MINKLLDSVAATRSLDMKLFHLQQALKLPIAEDLAKIFYYCYNPYITYGVAAKGSQLAMPYQMSYFPFELEALLQNLARREITGNAARLAVERLEGIYGDIVTRIVNKDLGIGINVKTVAKLFPQFQFEFAIQKAQPLSKVKHSLTYPMWMETKYDGVRLLARKEGKNVTLYTSNGRSPNFPVLSKCLLALPDAVYDGELVMKAGKVVNRSSVSGNLNSALKGGSPDETHQAYMIFDKIDLADWEKKSSKPLYRRRLELRLAMDFADSDYLFMSEVTEIFDLAQANDHFQEILAQGYEGIILKNPNSLYHYKRTTDWIKFKAEETIDAVCYEVIEGEARSKYEGMIGALRCTVKIDGVVIEFDVGSGLSDRDRMQDFNYYVGSVIEVKYNSVTKNAKGTSSLFLPRFLRRREDK